MKSRAYLHASKPTKGTTNGTTVGRVLLTAALAMGLLAGCTKEKTNESGGAFTGETITVPVTLTPEFMGGVTVKSAGAETGAGAGAGAGTGAGATGDAALSHSPGDLRSLMRVSAYTGPEAVAMAQAGTSAATRSQTGVDEGLVSDVWFVQLNAAGTAALQPPVYLNSGQLTDAQLPIELVAEPSMVYFLANSHNAALMNPAAALASFTKTTVEALSKAYTAEALEGDLTAQGMPMAGRWEGTPSGSALAVPLKRAVVKVTISLAAELPAGHSFAPKFIQVCRVPATLTLYRDAVAAPKPYPASSGAGAVAFTDYPREEISANLTATPIGFVYYLPENARGTGTGTTQQEKTAAKAPGAEGPFCTYVQIVGEYNNAARTELTKYTVFLGGDNTADYNLLRNNAYGVGITLKGGDPGLDVRITTLPITIESTEADKTIINLAITAGANGAFKVTEASGFEWTVTSADPSWLKIATNAAGAGAADFQTGKGNKTLYAYAPTAAIAEARTAAISVSRVGTPEKSIAVTQAAGPVLPPPHNGWAGCNVYWDPDFDNPDGTKGRLTFDDVGVTTHNNIQGVFFKWGSLVAISPLGAYNASASILFSPTGDKNYAYASIPYADEANILYNRAQDYLISIHDPDANTGNICRYISERGWAPGATEGKKWRMPVSSEFEAIADYIKFGAFAAAASTNANGTQVYNSGYTHSTGASFPTSGFYPGYATTEAGTTGLYMSASPYINNEMAAFYFEPKRVWAVKNYNKNTGAAVRCVLI